MQYLTMGVMPNNDVSIYITIIHYLFCINTHPTYSNTPSHSSAIDRFIAQPLCVHKLLCIAYVCIPTNSAAFVTDQ